MKAARLALLRGGVGAVRAEKLARDLHVTKGSFYWHFKDVSDVLDSLLLEWEEETATLFNRALEHPDPHQGLRGLLEEVQRGVMLSERGEAPSDAAIFAWAAVSAPVAKVVNRVEKQRIQGLVRISGRPDRAELAYYAYLGFIMRRRRVPEAAEGFPLLAATMLDLMLPQSKLSRSRAKSKRSYEKTTVHSAAGRQPASGKR